MKITFCKTEKNQGIIKITIEKPDFQKNVENQLKEYSKKVELKGFRKGKTPIGIIRKLYGKSLIVEEIDKLVTDKLNSYLKENEVHFLGEPMPKNHVDHDWNLQESFDFEYTIGYADNFEVVLDEKISIEKYHVNVSDDTLKQTIESLQQQFGNITTPEVASEEDILEGTINIQSEEKKIFIDLTKTKEKTSKSLIGMSVNTSIVLDPKQIFEDVDYFKNLLHLSDQDAKELKDQHTFSLKSIQRIELAEINQKFFDHVFGKKIVKSEDEFRAKVKETISKNYEQKSTDFFQISLIKKIVEHINIQLPNEFLKQWLLKTNEKLVESQLDDSFESYAKEISWSLIRNKIAKKQEIKVEEEKVIEKTKEIIKNQLMANGGMYGQLSEEDINTYTKNYLQSENGNNYLNVYNQLLDTKVTEYIAKNVNIDKKEVSEKEFNELL